MSSFESKLAASLSSAATQNAAREEATKEDRERRQADERQLADQLNRAKSTASRFKRDMLEPLFARIQKGISEQGWLADGNYIEGHAVLSGVVGQKLESGKCELGASVGYDVAADEFFLNVSSSIPGSECHNAVKPIWFDSFDDAAALAWFEDELAKAVGKWVGSGQLRRSNVVTHKPR